MKQVSPISYTDNIKNTISSTLRSRKTIDEIANDGHYNIEKIVSDTNTYIGDYIEENIPCIIDYYYRYLENM